MTRRQIKRANALEPMVGGMPIGCEYVGVTSPVDLEPHDCGVMVAVGAPHICADVRLPHEPAWADDATGWPV